MKHDDPDRSPMKLVNWFARLFLLAGLGYLGFYVYGVIMGVFSPTHMIVFSVLAAFFAIINVVHVIKIRREMKTVGGHEAMMRDLHTHRESRGF